ncbi:DUF3570 domain-containing protein [Flavobacterium sp. WV_118_3]|uniref:DUF3570 domain-containing protein n=1 Tax=Flavobacterium sp. WV_118_3 TaxID=3151764 RepID=UPI00321914CD
MKKILFYTGLFCCAIVNAQEDENATSYKKRVLESTEIEFLGSYYQQDGKHSAVGGGIGTEKLKDYTSNIVLTIPLNDDDVLTIDAGFSAYTSASSSNINPFVTDGSYTITTTNNNNTGASRGMNPTGLYSKDDDYTTTTTTPAPYGSPWIESTGASRKDVLKTLSASYSHSSDNRNTIWNLNGSASKEYDYQSFGVGAGVAKLFNDKNTEISLKASAYFDKWDAIYPTELHEYALYGLNFQGFGYFQGVTILDEYGQQSTNYLPKAFQEFSNENRNSYSFSLGLSQVLTKRLQVSLFMDVLYQEGLLSTPYHRIYFADKANYYIGQPRYIPIYDKPGNIGVFRLSDDVERLPGTRFKIPVGARLNYYISEQFVVRSYYRYYADDWGLSAHTASIEIPYRISEHFTLLPMYRFYTQKGVRYFAPFEKHYSYERYYTSDYDLSSFDSHQYGFGLSYTDLLTNTRILHFGLKNIDLRYQRYERSDALKADIISLGIKFVQ